MSYWHLPQHRQMLTFNGSGTFSDEALIAFTLRISSSPSGALDSHSSTLNDGAGCVGLSGVGLDE
jgi:hypothetical protein